jgi:hypothetical protein
VVALFSARGATKDNLRQITAKLLAASVDGLLACRVGLGCASCACSTSPVMVFVSMHWIEERVVGQPRIVNDTLGL